MKTINSILHFDLRPWLDKNNKPEDYYFPELRLTPSIQEEFITHFSTEFSIPAFSIKIKYYQRLIDNSITDFLNGIISETENESDNLIAFKLKKANGKIKSLLTEINDLILLKDYDLNLIASKHSDFSTDRLQKEATYIFQYMLTTLIKCYLEIQSHFSTHIHKDDILGIADIYSLILNRPASEYIFIREIQSVSIAPVELKKKTKNSECLSFTYTKLQKESPNLNNLFNSLKFALTTLKAGIIVGSGSASFEIIRDLVEKLPFMITPRWLKTKCQPIAIRNVVEFLIAVIGKTETYNKSYDIGGPNVLSYKEMLLRFAKIRGLKRRIVIVPVMTPKISSYWLYFVTSTSYALAKNLVNSMKIEVICKPNNLAMLLGIKLIDYDTSIQLAFDKIEQNQVLSSWKDAQTSDIISKGISKFIEVPVNGCFKDIRKMKVENCDVSLDKIWAIGGKTGWYYGNWLWEVRGFLDQIAGGVGMRRGRKSATEIYSGEALDFWRVLIANKEEKRLLLYAEMKLPGEAWQEFKIDENNMLIQTAPFRPLGLLGRLYWYSVLPFHGLIFKGMINKIAAIN